MPRRKKRVRFASVLTVAGIAASVAGVLPSVAHASVCGTEQPTLQTCLTGAHEAIQGAIDSTSVVGGTESGAENTVDASEQSLEPTINSADPAAHVSKLVAWTGYVAATVAGNPLPPAVGTPMATGLATATSTPTVATALRRISLRDNYYSDDGTCSGFASRPEGFYNSDDGTLRSSSDGYIECDFQDGYVPDINVFLQLYGSGPYNFTNNGSSRQCTYQNPCYVSDSRFFNLNCWQQGTYDHGAHLTGSWLDEAGYWHSVEYWAQHNRGRYYREC